MRRFLIPLVFVALLTVATVLPVAAGGPVAAPAHAEEGCSSV
mgnify:CR=1 FL=1